MSTHVASMASEIPGPRPWLLVGNLPNIDLQDSLQSIINIGKEHGPIFKLYLGSRESVFIMGHELANELCSRKDFVKLPASAISQLKAVVPQGLFSADHDDWFWGPAHRLLVPALGPMAIKAMFPEMHDIASQLVLRWARFGEDNAIDVMSDFTRLTIDTLALCTRDTRLNSFYKDKLHPFVGAMVNLLVESGNRAMRPGWLTALYRNTNKKYDDDNALVHRVAQEVFERRRKAGPSVKKDLLEAMLHGKDPATGQGLTDQVIIDNMITFLMAGQYPNTNLVTTGHETTACMLGFFVGLVVQHPAAYESVRKEIDSVVGQQPITIDDISRLPYIKACLREALRLYPPATGFSLTLTGDKSTNGPTTSGGKWPVKRQQPVFIIIPAVHRDPAAWGPDVDEFRPERMLEESFKKLPPGCYKPFGNGQRACIGSDFAMQESVLAMAMLFQKFDLKFVDPEYKLTVKQALTLKPQDLFIYAKPRPAIDVLNLQRDLLHGQRGSK